VLVEKCALLTQSGMMFFPAALQILPPSSHRLDSLEFRQTIPRQILQAPFCNDCNWSSS